MARSLSTGLKVSKKKGLVDVFETVLPKLNTIRRLLYVACTRAQCLLYLSHAEKRNIAGETKTRTISPFLAAVRTENQASIWSSSERMSCRLMPLNFLDAIYKNHADVRLLPMPSASTHAGSSCA